MLTSQRIEHLRHQEKKLLREMSRLIITYVFDEEVVNKRVSEIDRSLAIYGPAR